MIEHTVGGPKLVTNSIDHCFDRPIVWGPSRYKPLAGPCGPELGSDLQTPEQSLAQRAHPRPLTGAVVGLAGGTAPAPKKPRRFGTLTGKVEVAADFDTPLCMEEQPDCLSLGWLKP